MCIRVFIAIILRLNVQIEITLDDIQKSIYIFHRSALPFLSSEARERTIVPKLRHLLLELPMDLLNYFIYQ